MSRYGAKPGARSATGASPTGGRAARRRAALVGVLSLLVLCAQLVLAAPAGAVPLTGGFSPDIIGERADLNGDGVVNGRDDSNEFYGDTSIIDGRLDCNNWGLGVLNANDGTAGDEVILANDDCTLIGYDGTPDGVEITVSGGDFQVADGRLPTVFNASDPDNPDIGDSDFAWSAIGGRVDSNGDEAITGDDCHFGLIGAAADAGLGDPTDGADILGNQAPDPDTCGFVSPPAGANNGQVDLNSDTLITALADTCAGCFFGLDLAAGLVQSSGVDSITLDPTADTNTVGEDHTVTATVEDEFGNPIAGEDVHFDVTGDGTPDPASGHGITNAAGQATFTFTNETPGDNTITACVDADDGIDCDAGELTTTATKTWNAGEPFAITLEPATDTNPVDSDHVVTATVTDEFGNPLAGEDVHFAVSGGGTPDPASGEGVTNAAGQATFTFTNDVEATNTITGCVDDGPANNACDMGELADTASKTWEEREADSIALAPATAENDLGVDHVVTATVLDQFGDPFAGADVHFAVTGAPTPVPAAGEGVTNAAGQATFTFTNDSEGTNTITGCVDDGPANNACDVGELTATATKDWVELHCPGFAGDPRNQVVGTSGADVLVGTPGRDIICGLGGNDTLRGLGGNDLILGGGGADQAFGGPGRDTIRGGGGNDRLFGQDGRDRLFGQRGNDLLNGGPGNDLCRGGPGRDTLRNC